MEAYDNNDPYSDVLIGGMEVLDDNNTMKDQVSHPKPKQQDTATKISENNDLMSNINKNEYAQWEEITMADEVEECIKATEEEIKKSETQLTHYKSHHLRSKSGKTSTGTNTMRY